MKRFFTLAIALMCTVFAASAQNGDSDKKHEKLTPEQKTEQLATALSLTDDQKAKVLDLNKEYESLFADHHHHGPKPDGNSGATDKRPELTEEQKAEMKAHREQHEAYNAKLKEILTDEQYAKYQEMRPKGPRGGKDGKDGNK